MLITLAIISGLLLLFLGGEVLIRSAVYLAKKLGISSFIIGLTIVAYGTSSPELSISTFAALNNHADIALGNVIGSNISNILCVIGLTALIYPITINKKAAFYNTIVVLLVTIGFYLLCFLNELSRVSGAILLIILTIYTIIIFKVARQEKDHMPLEQTEEIEKQIHLPLTPLRSVLLMITGIILLILGSKLLIHGTVLLAKTLGVSEAIIGVTLVAFGSSLPELATSVIAAIRKHSDVALGNIIGSNLFNILGIIGITTLIKPLSIEPDFLHRDIPIMLLATLGLTVLITYCTKVSRYVGMAGFTSYILYIGYNFI